MPYNILPYTKQKAKLFNVIVEPSSNPRYKIDVFDKNSGHYITSCGAPSYDDFPTYMKLEKNGQVPVGYAQNRRRLYHL
jgi:hypothetical protein